MVWKQVSGGNAIDLKKGDGKPVEGVYKGSKTFQTKIGEQVVWQFEDDDGVPFGVYGFTNLNRAMELIKLDTLCKLTYQGTKNIKTKYGLKDVHQVSVEIQVDDTSPDSTEGIPF